MRVRITRQPTGSVQGSAVDCYKVGCVYDLAPALAEYLVLEGFAALEMRTQDEPTPVERRKPGWKLAFQRFFKSSGS